MHACRAQLIVEEAMKLLFTLERSFNLDISTLFNLKSVEVINQRGSASAKRNWNDTEQ